LTFVQLRIAPQNPKTPSGINIINMYRNLILSVAVLFTSTQAFPSVNGDFIKGFEVGIFMRGQSKMLKQYDCKDITKKNSKEYSQIMNLM